MRTECSPPTGCHRCGGELKGRRRAYCSEGCHDEHMENHYWNMARWGAEKRVQKLGIRCEGDGPHGGRHEVHHKEPLPDQCEYGKWSCRHHQEDLIVLCKKCHVVAHKKLRGTYRPERRRELADQGVML